MKISAKGRYALAATISMAEQHNSGEHITIISISERLGISKIYLEQIFSLLKRGGIVNSIKGSQGGYQLARMPHQITVLDILSSVELSLFEPAGSTVENKAPEIEIAMQLAAFKELDSAIRRTLDQVTLADLTAEAEKHKINRELMFYI